MPASLQVTLSQEVKVVTDKPGSNLSPWVPICPNQWDLDFFGGGTAISEYNVGDRTPSHNVPEGLGLILSA